MKNCEMMRMKSLFFSALFISMSLSGCGPSPSSTVTTESLHTIKIDNNSYIVSYLPERENYFHAISTQKGIVWNPVPTMEGKGLSAYTTSPFVLYLSPKDASKLVIKDNEIFTLPLNMDSPIGKLDVFLDGLFSNGNWVMYDTYLKNAGMNQPYLSKLYAINLEDNKNSFITDFHSGGGYQFSFGIYGDSVLFDQQTPNAQNNLTHNVVIYNLITGQQSKILWSEIQQTSGMEYIYKGNKYKMNPR